jgi:hypothetical protein
VEHASLSTTLARMLSAPPGFWSEHALVALLDRWPDDRVAEEALPQVAAGWRGGPLCLPAHWSARLARGEAEARAAVCTVWALRGTAREVASRLPLLRHPSLAGVTWLSLRVSPEAGLDEALAALCAAVPDGRLRALDLSELALDASSLRRLAHCTGLRSLETLRLPGLTDEAVAALAEATWPRLATLEAARSVLDRESAATLSESSRFPALVYLALPRSSLRSDALAALTAGGRLTALDVTDNQLDEPRLAALLAPPGAASLRRLVLRSNGLGDAGVAVVAACAHLHSVEHLDLGHTRAGDGAARALAASTSLGALRSLGLAGHTMTAAGVEALSRAPWCAGVASLDLSKSRFDAACCGRPSGGATGAPCGRSTSARRG